MAGVGVVAIDLNVSLDFLLKILERKFLLYLLYLCEGCAIRVHPSIERSFQLPLKPCAMKNLLWRWDVLKRL